MNAKIILVKTEAAALTLSTDFDASVLKNSRDQPVNLMSMNVKLLQGLTWAVKTRQPVSTLLEDILVSVLPTSLVFIVQRDMMTASLHPTKLCVDMERVLINLESCLDNLSILVFVTRDGLDLIHLLLVLLTSMSVLPLFVQSVQLNPSSHVLIFPEVFIVDTVLQGTQETASTAMTSMSVRQIMEDVLCLLESSVLILSAVENVLHVLLDSLETVFPVLS